LVLVFGVVVVVVGYPLAVFHFLRKSHRIVVAKRKEKQKLQELHGTFVVNHDDKDNDDPLDEMTEAYVDRCYYWETVAMLRKFVLTAGLVIFRNGSTMQLLLGVFVSSFYLVAFMHVKPMRRTMDYRLETVASTQLILALAIGLAVRADAEARLNPASDETLIMNKDAMTVMLVLFNVTVFLFGAYAIGSELRSAKKKETRMDKMRRLSAGGLAGAAARLAASKVAPESSRAAGPSVANLRAEIKKFEAEKSSQKAEIASLKAEKSSQKAEIASLKAEIAALKAGNAISKQPAKSDKETSKERRGTVRRPNKAGGESAAVQSQPASAEAEAEGV